MRTTKPTYVIKVSDGVYLGGFRDGFAFWVKDVRMAKEYESPGEAWIDAFMPDVEVVRMQFEEVSQRVAELQRGLEKCDASLDLDEPEPSWCISHPVHGRLVGVAPGDSLVMYWDEAGTKRLRTWKSKEEAEKFLATLYFPTEYAAMLPHSGKYYKQSTDEPGIWTRDIRKARLFHHESEAEAFRPAVPVPVQCAVERVT